MLQKMIAYRNAEQEDGKAITELLSALLLPVSDVGAHLHFIIAQSEGRLIGCIAAEIYGNEALIRSFAVDPDYRGRRIGIQLYNLMIAFTRSCGITTLHLLTTTASGYFEKLGFHEGDRKGAPESIRNTKEFSDLCPSTAKYMVMSSVS